MSRLEVLDHGEPICFSFDILSAFDGPGTRDAFEAVTRAVTGQRYRLAPELAPADAPRGPEGQFFFRGLRRQREPAPSLRI